MNADGRSTPMSYCTRRLHCPSIGCDATIGSLVVAQTRRGDTADLRDIGTIDLGYLCQTASALCLYKEPLSERWLFIALASRAESTPLCNFLARSAKLPMFFLSIFFMVDILDPVAQNLMDQSLPKFHDWQMGERASSPHLAFFRFLKGRCNGNQLKLKKSAFFRGPIYFVVLPSRNGLQYCNSDFKILTRINFSTLCMILVAFGPET